MVAAGELFIRLKEIISRLRAPDGCPWDRKQTPHTFKSYLMEEAHELLEAINQEDAGNIKEELGDMLFQVVFLTQLYEERHEFSLADVIEGITAKMVRRHPHVFGGTTVDDEKELRRQWNEIKARESGKKKKPGGMLTAVPKSLPALRRAQRVSERAARTGFEWPDAQSAFAKIEEELAELKEACSSGDKEKINEEIGDLLLSLVTLSRKLGTNSEDALSSATDKFINRFIKMETAVAASGGQLSGLDKEQLVSLWQQTK